MEISIHSEQFEENSSDLRKDSPTCSREGQRLVYLAAATMSWRIRSLDFTSAFLQGDEIQREIYIRPPRDVSDKKTVWKLRKCIYGLTDAPRSWFTKMKTALLSLGGKQSKYDSALFMWHTEDEKLSGIIAAHVDDFIYAGNKTFQSQVIEELKIKFKIGQEAEMNFRYVGLSVKQSRDEIKVNQDHYISSIEPIKISKDRHQDSQ